MKILPTLAESLPDLCLIPATRKPLSILTFTVCSLIVNILIGILYQSLFILIRQSISQPKLNFLLKLSSDVESVNREVKKGSDTTISCVITGITETATVTWRTSTGPVPAEKFTPVQGKNSGGTQTSTLAVDGTLVNEDTAYTCRVTSGSLPDSSHSETTVNLNIYGMALKS